MKNILIALFIILCITSCSYDDSLLTGRVDSLESRVQKLEELCNQMNTNIEALQSLVNALENNDCIISVVPIDENGETIGYTITFKKSLPITIYHGKDGVDGLNGVDGKDGTTPVIGVKKDVDGIYYWTLNGEWLKDNVGNKIKAQGTDGKDGEDGQPGVDGEDGKDGEDGQPGVDGEDGKDGEDGQPGADGKDGITPKLKIEGGYWYVSYDNGVTWTQLGQAVGPKGDKGEQGEKGEQGMQGEKGEPGGDSVFADVEDRENEVVFTLANGEVIVIPKGVANELDIVFSVDESVNVLPGKTYEIGYTLIGADENTVIDVVAQNGYRAEVDKYDYKSGKIIITAPETAIDDRIIVLVNDGGGQTIMRFINIAESIIRITTNSYTIESSGGIQQVEVETNINYTVHIAEADRSWVSLLQTRADVHKETLTFQFHANPNTTYRYATVELQDESGMVGQSILFAQKASGFKTVHVEIGGTLESYISENEKESLIGLKLTGYLNSLDYDFIRTMSKLETVDLAQIDNTTMPPSCFKESKIEEVILPLNLTAIPDNAFYDSEITKIDIPATVTSIGNYAFYNCTKLAGNLILPECITSIGEYAFYNCSKLSGNLVLPDSLEIIGESAFYYCSGFIGDLIIPNKVSVLNRDTFRDCEGFTGNLIIGDNVEIIDRYCFAECTGFKGYLMLGSKINEIRERAITNYYAALGTDSKLNFYKVYCKALNPPRTSTSCVNVNTEQLVVPINCKKIYEKDSWWSRYFSNIEEAEF